MIKGESEERSIHRFEAFSDIVIGFSLAQLGASLAIPAHPAVLFENPTWLIAFFWAFAMVCAMWWFHHRFFAQLFVPRAAPVLLNFLWLAIVVLCVYAAQLSSRNLGDVTVWRMYFIVFALAYGLLALQYRIGMRLRGDELTPEKKLAALRAGTFMQLWTAPFIVCAIALFVLPFGLVAGLIIDASFIATVIVSTMLVRRFRRAQPASIRGAV